VFDDSWTQIGLVSLIFLPAMFYSLIMPQFVQWANSGKDDFKNKGSEIGWFTGALVQFIGKMDAAICRYFGFLLVLLDC